MQTAWPVAITPSGSAAVATVVWRRGGRLFVTVIVKATFALVANEPMVPVPPEAIFVKEQEGPPGFALRSADDLAPYLGQTDVTLLGHAVAARAPGLRAIPVRLGIARDGVVLLDRKLAVEVPQAQLAAGSGPLRVPIPQMGPLSRSWPVRSRLLGAADPRALSGVFLEIPDPFDWRYFQAAPAEQRIAPLRGAEWLLLEGMHPTLARFTSRLPGLRGVARVLGRQPEPGAWRPLDLVLDAVWIDADRRRCSLTWRGHFPVGSDRELGSLAVIAGVEAAAQAPAAQVQAPLPAQRPSVVQAPSAAHWPSAAQAPLPATAAEEDPLAGTIALEDVDLRAVEDDDPLAGTLGLTEQTAAEIAARPAVPFHADAAPPPAPAASPAPAALEHDPLAGTLGLTEQTAAEIAARPVTPFHDTASTPVAIAEDPLLRTLGLAEETASEIAARPATPFFGDTGIAAPSPAPEDDPLAGTLGLTEQTAAEIAARPATPFVADRPSVSPTTPSPAAPEQPGAPVLARPFDLEIAAPAPAPAVTPPLPPLLDAGIEEGAMPEGLGAQFLLAMGVKDEGVGAT
jgi:hypothetical protein